MRRALLLSALFVAAAQSQPPSPTPSEAGQDKQQTTSRKDAKDDGSKGVSPVTGTVINTPVAQDSTKHEENLPSPDWLIRIFTGVIAAAAIVQAYIYWHQKELMSAALAETKKAAEAATKSANVSETALKLTQCADVLMDAVSIVDPAGQPALVTPASHVSIRFKNFGHTRADNVIFKVSLDKKGVPDSSSSNGPGVLGAGDAQIVSFIRFGSFLTERTAAQINSGNIVMRVKGTVSYLDVFGDVHETKIGCRYSAKLRGFRDEEDPDPEDEEGQENR